MRLKLDSGIRGVGVASLLSIALACAPEQPESSLMFNDGGMGDEAGTAETESESESTSEGGSTDTTDTTTDSTDTTGGSTDTTTDGSTESDSSGSSDDTTESTGSDDTTDSTDSTGSSGDTTESSSSDDTTTTGGGGEGYSWNGAVWYLADGVGQTCNDFCASHGGAQLSAQMHSGTPVSDVLSPGFQVGGDSWQHFECLATNDLRWGSTGQAPTGDETHPNCTFYCPCVE